MIPTLIKSPDAAFPSSAAGASVASAPSAAGASVASVAGASVAALSSLLDPPHPARSDATIATLSATPKNFFFIFNPPLKDYIRQANNIIWILTELHI